jgi:hypothetical protein
MKGFEKDKSIVTQQREESFYREARQQLGVYFDRSQLPWVLAGTKKQVAEFYDATGWEDKAAGVVTGSYSAKNFFDLRTRAWSAYVDFRQQHVLNLVHTLKEEAEPNRLAKGIQEVWEAAHEGRGQLLVVEKDYMPRAYLRDGEPVLYLQPPQPRYTLVPDAVDSIIETVLDKGGQVMFTEDKQLRPFDSIALQLRY